jgi:hypothetical protein
MYLVKDRKWFQTVYPVVHSIVQFSFGDETVEIPKIAGALNLEAVDEAHLERSVRLHYPMTALMPFGGGIVDITAGLLAMQGDNSLNRFIKVMGDLSGLLAVTQLSAALTIAGPIASGVQELLTGSDGQLHLGVHQAFASAGGKANEFRPGYSAIVLADQGSLAADELWVRDGRLYRGSSPSSSFPMTRYAYMLLLIEKRHERDDWDKLSTIMQPFKAALQALGEKEVDRAEAFQRSAIAAALLSPDLTWIDRKRVAQTLKSRYQEARSLGLGAVPGGQDLSLSRMMESAPTFRETRVSGEASIEELLA